VNRRGAALAAVLLLLTVSGLILGLSWPLARGALVRGQAAIDGVSARAGAETAIADVLNSWPSAADSLPVGSPLIVPGSPLGVRVEIRRLTDRLWWVRSHVDRTDRSGRIVARAGVGLVVRRFRVGGVVVGPEAVARGWFQVLR
jgi:hypothetical protein